MPISSALQDLSHSCCKETSTHVVHRNGRRTVWRSDVPRLRHDDLKVRQEQPRPREGAGHVACHEA